MQTGARTFLVPLFVKITLVAKDPTSSDAYVISNEATGKYFKANLPTVKLLDGLRRNSDISVAISEAQLNAAEGKSILERLIQYGVVVQAGKTAHQSAPKTPLESRAISIRFDLINAARLTKRFDWLGRLVFSWSGFVIWCVALMAMVYFLFSNPEKINYAMSQTLDAGFWDFVRFGILIVGLKAVHELGHALAYRMMCLREGHEPGPIRMGISFFAFTPFPFTDVTGAWRLRSKWRRAAIGAGGIYFELGMTAMLTAVWAATGSETLQVSIFQVVMFTAATTIIFNLNPLIKLDGYYVLSDVLEQYNLFGKAALAAQRYFGRMFGAELPKPDRRFLIYWIMSYLYRWSIFSGIFWIAYQIDPRLAVPAAVVVAMMLIVRPLMRSFQFTIKQGMKPLQSALTLTAVIGFGAICFMPFPDRILMNGRLSTTEATYVFPQENARLDGAGFSLVNPELVFQVADLTTRQQILENASRAVTMTPAEQARLLSDRESLDTIKKINDARLENLAIDLADGAQWTAIASRVYSGSWVRPNLPEPLGTITTETDPIIHLWLDERSLEQGVIGSSEFQVSARLSNDPTCEFNVQIAEASLEIVTDQKSFKLTGFPLGEGPDCLNNYPQGAALVARLRTPPKSVAQRAVRLGRQLLQNRLPGIQVEQEL